LPIGFVAVTSFIGAVPGYSFFAFLSGMLAYIGTIWVVRVFVAVEIFLEILIEVARRRTGSQEGRGGGRLAAPSGEAAVDARYFGWRDVLSA
jgi:hypothetical protein